MDVGRIKEKMYGNKKGNRIDLTIFGFGDHRNNFVNACSLIA